jgi:plastocyanin
MPNSGRGYSQNSFLTPQTDHRRSFSVHHRRRPCRLQRPRGDARDTVSRGFIPRRSGDQSQLTDVSSFNHHGESGHHDHLAQRRGDHAHRDVRTLSRRRQDNWPASFAEGRRHVQRKACRKRQPFSFTFTKPGIYTYYCDIHQGMNVTITVVGENTSAEGDQK